MKKSLSKKMQQNAKFNYRFVKAVGLGVIGLPLFMLGAGYPHIASAEEAQKPDKTAVSKPETLPEVKVSISAEKETAIGPVSGYLAKRAISATKTDTPILETPQSISVITADQIADQKALSIQEALRYSAGVVADQYGQDSRSDTYAIRGMDSTQYLDGLRHINTYYSETIRPDPYMMERIEVLRGPSSVLYGSGGVGGIVNLVSKRPLTEARREVGISLGNYDFKQIQADFTGPVADSNTLFYRLVAVGKDTNTQVQHAGNERTLIAPSLTWKPSDKTTLTLMARYQLDNGLPTAQFLPVYGVLLPNPNGKINFGDYMGEPNRDKYRSESTHLGWAFEHKFNETWTIRQNVRYTSSSNNYNSFYLNSFTFDPTVNPYTDANQRILNRYHDVSKTRTLTFNADTNAEARFLTGALDHRVLMGMDYAHFRQTGDAGFDNGAANPIDVYDPQYGNFNSLAVLSKLPEAKLMQTGIYVQDQIKFGEGWIATAGLRHDKAENRKVGEDSQEDHKVTGRYALSYVFENGWAPYLSYAESFLPVAPSYKSATNGLLKPQEGRQWEAGLKYIPAGGKSKLTFALFDIKDQNRPIYLAQGFYVQKGEIHTRGAEVEGATTFGDRWSLLGSYSFTDARYSKTNVDVERGNQVETVPKHLASAWLTKRFSLGSMDGFRAGAGIRYVGESWDSTHFLNTPDVTLFDAMLGLDRGSWRYALNASNLADKEYVSTCISRGDCWIGARRAAIASATYSW